MPYQSKGYCYPTVQEAANAIQAEGFQVSGSGIVSPFSYATLPNPADANKVSMTFSYKAFSTANPVNYVNYLAFPTCTSVGPMTSNTGLSVDDSIQLAWLVVGVFAAAWAIKSLRRAL